MQKQDFETYQKCFQDPRFSRYHSPPPEMHGVAGAHIFDVTKSFKQHLAF